MIGGKGPWLHLSVVLVPWPFVCDENERSVSSEETTEYTRERERDKKHKKRVALRTLPV